MNKNIFSKMTNYRPPVWVIAWIIFIPLNLAPAIGAEKLTVGAVEEVVVLPWNIKLLARIDTGAAMSSIDARNIRVKNNTVEFKLVEPGGEREITLPVVRWSNIQTSEGAERRPVVQLQLCIGTRLVSTAVNLNDRAKMDHSLLLGRRALRGRFIVDVSHRKMLPPNCVKGHAR